ncbi:hypothetical protein [Staphylococcus casei]|uniref:Uncharacterized protein n=1 Tax=Staphylococcus casei TaxID=201828 RepID=A0ABZ2WEU4_9STAP
MFESILIVVAMACLGISVIIGIGEIIKVLIDRKYRVKWKLVILFFCLYIVFYIPAVILLNV